MNKKGFTLIELAISLVLLSVVLIFLLNFYNQVRIGDNDSAIEAKLELNKSLISSNLNRDIFDCGGILAVTCSSNTCNITLNNNQERILELLEPAENGNSYKKLRYIDASNNEIIYTREAIDGYNFKIKYEELTTIYKITINQWNDKAYQIELISRK